MIIRKLEIMSVFSFREGNLLLFGGGNAWKFEFATEDKFPSTLNLKHSKGSILVPVLLVMVKF
jgi:hypothetical protein